MVDANKHLMDIVPFRLGSRVRIAPTNRYAADWPDVYVITGLQWTYQIGHFVNIAIASDEEIQGGSGPTDGWHVEDLLPA